MGACGAVKIGDHWVLIADDCELMQGHVFITGFEQLSTTSGDAQANV